MDTTTYINKTSLDKISLNLTVLDGENGMIKLDKNNSAHVDWFEDEETVIMNALYKE